MFRWGNEQREVYLNLLITGKRVAAQPISVTLAGFGRIWADEKAQPLGSRWHFQVYHQNAKLVNEFLTWSGTAWMARAESEQKNHEQRESRGTEGCSSLSRSIQTWGWDAARKKVPSRANLTAARSKNNSLYYPFTQTAVPLCGASGRLRWVITGAF